MMIKRSILSTMVLAFYLVLSGCVNTPTENVQPKDDRPYIMFSQARADDVVFLDGINMGVASDYPAEKVGMRIEPGTHILQIKRAGKTIFNQKFYVADGASKTFTIGSN